MLLGAWTIGGKPDKSAPKKGSKLRLVLLCSGYIAFLMLGAAIFSAIEAKKIQDITKRIENFRNKFLQNNTCVNDSDLEDFLKAIIEANNRGISPLRNASNELNWSFGEALFFSGTIVTTIGYGRVAPLSHTGKMFCMVYAAFGIPLTLILFAAVVEKLQVPSNLLLGAMNSKLGHLYQPFHIRLLHFGLLATMVSTLFFAVPTIIFCHLEPGWSVLDAFYYCFISLTTIGLGDFIPDGGLNAENRSLYKICLTIYLILGLSSVMFILNIFYDIPELHLQQLFTENLNGETQKLRLSGNNATCYSGSSGHYMTQKNEEEIRRAVVRIRPHSDDSPSPDDGPSTTLKRSIQIP